MQNVVRIRQGCSGADDGERVGRDRRGTSRLHANVDVPAGERPFVLMGEIGRRGDRLVRLMGEDVHAGETGARRFVETL